MSEPGAARPRIDSASVDTRPWIERHAAWMLIAFGMILLALAALFADKTAISAVFAVGGIAMPLLGVLLPRIHGQVELSATGFKVFLTEVGKGAEGLSARAKAEVLELVIEQAQHREPPRGGQIARERARAIVSAGSRAAELASSFNQWLEVEGWVVQAEVADGSGATRFDLIGEKDGEVLVAEVKYRLAGREWLRRLREVRWVREAAQKNFGRAVRFALVLAEPPSDGVITRLREMDIEAYVQHGASFQRLG